MKWLIAVALVACACPSKQAGTPTTGGSGSATGSGTVTREPTGCEALSGKLLAMYRAEPKATDEVAADNTAMVIAACRRAPDKLIACIAGATTIEDLEAQCMPKLDDEGSEADVLLH